MDELINVLVAAGAGDCAEGAQGRGAACSLGVFTASRSAAWHEQHSRSKTSTSNSSDATGSDAVRSPGVEGCRACGSCAACRSCAACTACSHSVRVGVVEVGPHLHHDVAAPRGVGNLQAALHKGVHPAHRWRMRAQAASRELTCWAGCQGGVGCAQIPPLFSLWQPTRASAAGCLLTDSNLLLPRRVLLPQSAGRSCFLFLWGFLAGRRLCAEIFCPALPHLSWTLYSPSLGSSHMGGSPDPHSHQNPGGGQYPPAAGGARSGRGAAGAARTCQAH